MVAHGDDADLVLASLSNPPPLPPNPAPERKGGPGPLCYPAPTCGVQLPLPTPNHGPCITRLDLTNTPFSVECGL